MHTRRQAQASAPISSLSLVLPHPPLPRRTPATTRASQANGDAEPSPRTPRSSCGMTSPSLFKLESYAPRRSTDSWNSSNYDGGEDDMEWEWTTEQLALLNKTLDAIPSHTLTPYNGPIPPPNVLDRIAKSITNAKSPLEWRHSVRSTRVKLLNLARSRAQEDQDPTQDRDQNQILKPTNVPRKPQPLYRQSSMDFLKGNTLNHEKSIDRLSTRLQRADRTMPNPAGNPYIYSPDSPASRHFNLGDDPYTPTTPTDGELPAHLHLHHRNSGSSLRGPRLRRSTTTISGLPTIPWGEPAQHSNLSPHGHLQHLHVPAKSLTIKRSGSFSSPSKNGLGHSLKRAPSYGTLSTRSSSSRMSVDVDDDQKENSPALSNRGRSPAVGLAVKHIKQQQQLDIYPSSDDEEKVRSKKVKKQRMSVSSSTKTSSSLSKVTSSSTLKSNGTATPKGSVRSHKTSSKSARVTRSSSMFGAELPHPQPNPPIPASAYSTYPLAHAQSPVVSPPSSVIISPEQRRQVRPTSPVSPTKTLRRIKTTNFPRAQVSRRISFGSLIAPVQEEESPEAAAAAAGLGSAFQLQ